jgi:UDP:flavonoid glycosyltransferase YjiC (YdhE family)
MLFTDIDPGAFMLRQVTGLPLANTYQDVMTQGKDTFSWKIMRRAMAAALKAHGKPALDPHQLYFDPAILKIVPSIPELDGTDPARRDICYVGHLLGDVQVEAAPQVDPAQRYVLVYVGTGSISLEKLRAVLPQVFSADGPLTCLVGAQSVEQPKRYGGVEFRPYIPVEALLPQSDWMICHGGQNSIIQALRRDVPLLIFPGPIFERRFNARKVQEAGAGRMGEIDDFNPDWLRRALTQQTTFAQSARNLGEKIRSGGGAEAAVQAIERLYSTARR